VRREEEKQRSGRGRGACRYLETQEKKVCGTEQFKGPTNGSISVRVEVPEAEEAGSRKPRPKLQLHTEKQRQKKSDNDRKEPTKEKKRIKEGNN